MTTAASEVTLIQIGRRELQLDDTTYRALLANLASGKTSSKALSAAERQAVLTHMKARGFVVKPNKAKAVGSAQHDPRLTKLRAMYYVMADAGHVQRPTDTDACMAAIEIWALRQLGTATPPLAALRFATGPQINELIERMKAWLRRLDLPTA